MHPLFALTINSKSKQNLKSPTHPFVDITK